MTFADHIAENWPTLAGAASFCLASIVYLRTRQDAIQGDIAETAAGIVALKKMVQDVEKTQAACSAQCNEKHRGVERRFNAHHEEEIKVQRKLDGLGREIGDLKAAIAALGANIGSLDKHLRTLSVSEYPANGG